MSGFSRRAFLLLAILGVGFAGLLSSGLIQPVTTASSTPVITSVSPISPNNKQTITITGSGFGDTPPQTITLDDGSVDTVSCNVNTPSLAIDDMGEGSHRWEAGKQTCSYHNAIGVYLQSWSDTQIVLDGLGCALKTNGQGTWNIAAGDPLVVNIWGPNQAGPVQYSITVTGTSTNALCSYGVAVTDYPLQNSVTLDGKYTSSTEWSDVKDYTVEGVYGPTLYWAAKYDVNYLYFVWDFVECTKPFQGNATQDANQVMIYLNPTNKPTIDPTFYRVWSFGTRVTLSRGTSLGDWTPSQTASGDISSRSEFTSSPHSQLTHMIVEMRVALTFANLRSSMSGPVGFATGAWDGRHGVWAGYPNSWDYRNPSSWGSLQFSQIPVPEFPSVPIAILVPFLLVFAVGLRFRRSAKQA